VQWCWRRAVASRVFKYVLETECSGVVEESGDCQYYWVDNGERSWNHPPIPEYVSQQMVGYVTSNSERNW